VADAARLFIIPTVAFIVAIVAVIVAGLLRSHPVVAPIHTIPQATDTVGLLLILKAFASGCSALTGVEAIADPAGAGGQHLVRRAAGAGQLGGRGQLPAAPLLPQGRAPGAPVRRDRAGGVRRRAAGRLARGHPQALVPLFAPLVTLFSPHRSLGAPIVDYLHQLEQRDPHRRLVVLISELEPRRLWQWILPNQRGLVLDRAIRNGTDNVVICRMRFRPTTWSAN
jgi:hypothetical protein